MSNAYNEFEIDDETPDEAGNAVKELRKKLTAAHKLLKEKDAEVTELKKFQTQVSVQQFLKDVPERFHKLAQRELADNPTPEGFAAFVKDYGDLWGAEGLEDQLSPEDAVTKAALEKIQAAERRARNIQDEPFKMPSQLELRNMSPVELAKVMAQAKQQGYMAAMGK